MKGIITEGGPTCLIVQPIHAAGLDRLVQAGIRPVPASASDPGTVLREIGAACAVITRNAGLSAEAMAAAPGLKVVAVHGTGTDAVAVGAAAARGITVCNTPGANAQSVAEHAIALILALAKAIPSSDAAVRRADHAFKYEARFLELSGLTCGLVGLGEIGRAVAGIARALGMRVIGVSRQPSPAAFAATGVEPRPSLDALLAESDVVSLHLPLTAQTRQMIGMRELALMKRSAFLVNTSRGGLLDEAALADALARGVIAGAGLDVFATEPLPSNSPLAGLPNVVLSPHTAGSTAQALERMARLAADQVVDVLAGRAPRHPVSPMPGERR